MGADRADSKVIRVEWRAVDGTSQESAAFVDRGDGHDLAGRIAFTDGGTTAYEIRCDRAWRTFEMWVRFGGRALHVTRNARGAWLVDGVARPELDGCDDVDLSGTPATNTLPIRRLALPVGASADASAAWVRLPELRVERLDQRYTRVAEHRWQYESDDGAFRATLDVDADGIVERYENGWTRI